MTHLNDFVVSGLGIRLGMGFPDVRDVVVLGVGEDDDAFADLRRGTDEEEEEEEA